MESVALVVGPAAFIVEIIGGAENYPDNQATVAAIKSTWLRRACQVRAQIVHHKVPIYSPATDPAAAGRAG